MKVSISDTVSAKYPKLRFATVAGTIDPAQFSENIDALADNLRETITFREQEILDALSSFDSFFRGAGYHSPLHSQLSSTKKKGLPPVPALVKSLLYAEMTTGVLMGVQDGNTIDGDLLLDLAEDGESFVGMRSLIRCQTGEVVVRDHSGIVASLFQGPDKRTQIQPETSFPVFYVFSTPDLPAKAFDYAIETVSSLFTHGSDVVKCEAVCPVRNATIFW